MWHFVVGNDDIVCIGALFKELKCGAAIRGYVQKVSGFLITVARKLRVGSWSSANKIRRVSFAGLKKKTSYPFDIRTTVGCTRMFPQDAGTGSSPIADMNTLCEFSACIMS
jgi:hypothetical protein